MAELHPLVAGFSDAEAYELGRPGYRRSVVEALARALELAPGARILDLGAGTGKLSRALLAGGYDVVAVEPLASMREVLAAAIGAERVREGTAEAIPLADASVDAITCADSFHWFDEPRAMPELRRVLRPGGGVAILRADAHLVTPWLEEFAELILRHRGEHPGFGERAPAAALEEDPAFGAVHEQMVTAPDTTDRERILTWISTFSWIGRLTAERRREILGQAEQLLEREGVTELGYEIHFRMWTARLSSAGQ
jgi:SAM-dependent methyltransferase